MVIVAEAFGALALVINFIGYRQNNINRYLLISAVSLACISVHFFLLDAMAAGIACGLASARNVIAVWNRSNSVLVFFVLVNIGFFLYEWFVLENSWIIWLAYTSSLIFTVGSIVLRDAIKIRQLFIFAELFGLAYALLVGSIFGSIFNISNLISIVSKLRQDLKQREKPAVETQ